MPKRISILARRKKRLEKPALDYWDKAKNHTLADTLARGIP